MSFRHIFCAVLLGAFAPAVAAADNLVITVNVTIRTLTLEWADTNLAVAARDWNLNAVWGGTYDSNTHGSTTGVGAVTLPAGLTRYNVINKSGAPVDLSRAIVTPTWALGATNGVNICVLDNALVNTPNAGNYLNITTVSATTIASALADSATQYYDLRIQTPASGVGTAAITVTLTATISP